MNNAIGLDKEREEFNFRPPKNVMDYLRREAEKDNRSLNNYLTQLVVNDMIDKAGA